MFKSLLLLISLFLVGSTNPQPVDTAASTVTWKAYKVTGSHEGTVALQSGDLTFEDGRLTGGQIVIDMTTIAVTDITGNSAAKLTGHLKSADFFGVETHPVATLDITKVVSRGTPGDYRVTADITIKEATETIRFNARVSEAGDTYVATADLKLDRTDFDVRYGSGSFFENLGDKTIYDEFDLGVELVVAK